MWHSCLILAGVLTAILGPSPPASAHKLQPPEIIFQWGPFSAQVFHCLQTLAHIGRRCSDRVLRAERTCADKRLAGQPCDDSARLDLIAAATSRIAPQIQAACRGGQLTELWYLNPDDARNDLNKACTEQPAAIVDLLYGPALAAAPSGADPTTQQCVREVTAASMQHFRLSLGLRRRALNRIGDGRAIIGPEEKRALLNGAAQAIAADRQSLATQFALQCPTFAAIFQRDPASLLTTIEHRADCVLFASYVQSSITCPTNP